MTFLIGVFNLSFLSFRIEAFRIIYIMVGHDAVATCAARCGIYIFSVRCRGELRPETARSWTLVSLSEYSGPRNSKWSIL